MANDAAVCAVASNAAMDDCADDARADVCSAVAAGNQSGGVLFE